MRKSKSRIDHDQWKTCFPFSRAQSKGSSSRSGRGQTVVLCALEPRHASRQDVGRLQSRFAAKKTRLNNTPFFIIVVTRVEEIVLPSENKLEVGRRSLPPPPLCCSAGGQKLQQRHHNVMVSSQRQTKQKILVQTYLTLTAAQTASDRPPEAERQAARQRDGNLDGFTLDLVKSK